MSQPLFWLQCHCPKMWYKKITLLTGSEGQEVNQGTAGKWLGTGTSSLSVWYLSRDYMQAALGWDC